MTQLRAAAILFFAAYFAVQLAGKTFAQKGEFFPVFSWSLFSDVRNDVTAVVVEVTRVDEKVYSPPRDYFDLDETFPAAKRRDISLTKAARRLAYATTEPDVLAQREAQFEERFFDIDASVDYQLVLIRFDPLERWRTGQVVGRNVIYTHSTRSLP